MSTQSLRETHIKKSRKYKKIINDAIKVQFQAIVTQINAKKNN